VSNKFLTQVQVSKNVRLTYDQKLVKASLIYRTEPKQNRICKKRCAAIVHCVSPGERVRTYGGKDLWKR